MRGPVVLAIAAASCGRLHFVDHDDASVPGDGQRPIDTVTTGDAAQVAPSCVGLPATCNSLDCCTVTSVPGGTFYRGYDVGTDGMYPSMASPATVSAFHLDKFEVTVGRFRAFVNAGKGLQTAPPNAGDGAHALISGSGWLSAWNASLNASTSSFSTSLVCDATYGTWTPTAAGNEDLPINCVTWYEAMAFCIWDGGYLPTEAEWNFAAAGGSEQRVYAFSNPASALAIDCSHTNYSPSAACVAAGTTPVGSHSPGGDGKWGQADITGNVFEWTLDYDAAYPTPCNDCANLTVAAMRTLRGGDWGDTPNFERTAYRGTSGTPTTRDSGVGIRCARP
jgi:formylglycine-generating enzyme required for sulfatase activity